MRTKQPARPQPEWLAKLVGNDGDHAAPVLTPPQAQSAATRSVLSAVEAARRAHARFTIRPATRPSVGQLAATRDRVAS